MKISPLITRLLLAISVMTGACSLSAQTDLTLAYALPIYVVNTAAPIVTPTIGYETDGTATTYTVSAGALPSGLSLNAADGTITGTPTTAASSTFTITAQNGTQSASAALSTTVIATSTRLSRSMLAMGNQARLQRLIAKGRAGTAVKIATIGGSITQGSLATTTTNRYANLVNTWWHTTFTSSTSTLINAGIGATGSNYGALRVQRDVLDQNPDLVIVEFAVNDSAGISTYGDSFEGLLRQILNDPNQPAIIVLYMTGCTYNGAQSWQSIIAANYDLPGVSYEDAVKPEITAGTLLCATISSDGTHPNNVGHALVADLVTNMLSASITAFPVGSTAASIPETPEPLRTDAFEFTTLTEGAALDPTGIVGWTAKAAGTIPAGLESSIIGSTVGFEVSGTNILVSWWMNTDGEYGKAKVSVDGVTVTTLNGNFDGGWGDYREMVSLGSNFSSGTHTVIVELLSERDSTSTGNMFRLIGIGTASSTYIDAPAWADTNASNSGWYSSWYGWFYTTPEMQGWIYSDTSHYQYIYPTSTPESMWIWDNVIHSWAWTRESYDGIDYVYSKAAWYYYMDGDTPNRRFWDYANAEYIFEDALK